MDGIWDWVFEEGVLEGDGRMGMRGKNGNWRYERQMGDSAGDRTWLAPSTSDDAEDIYLNPRERLPCLLCCTVG